MFLEAASEVWEVKNRELMKIDSVLTELRRTLVVDLFPLDLLLFTATE